MNTRMNDTNSAGRFASHKITNAALDRMAAIVEAQATGQGMDIPERLRIARDFDMEIEHAAGNPTLGA